MWRGFGWICICAVIIAAASVFAVDWFVPRTVGEEPLLPEAEIVVGQSFIVGIAGPDLNEANVALLRAVRPGGVVLYRYNLTSEEQAKRLVSELQGIALETTGIPYFVMIDEEPGGASRLDVFEGAFKDGQADWAVIEKGVKRLRDVGVNVVLAPLADLPLSDEVYLDYRLPLRGEAELAAFNERFIRTLRQNGIDATLKHFPGLGFVPRDTHKELIRSDAPFSTIERSMSLFKEGIKSGAAFVMTNHSIYDAIDPSRSASLSPSVMRMLRDAGFEGMIITDDIANMPVGAPRQIGVNDAVLGTLMAGHTMALLGSKRMTTAAAYDSVLEAYKDDAEVRERIDDNYRLILRHKGGVI